METKKLVMLISYIYLSASMFFWELLPRVMLMFSRFVRVSFCSFIFDVLGFITKYIFRLKTNYADPGENAANFGAIQSLSDDQNDQNPCKDLISGGFMESEKDFNRNRRVTEDSVFKQDGFSSSESKYLFLSSKNVSAFIVDPKVITFSVEEMFVGSNDFGITKEIVQFQPADGCIGPHESSNDSSVNEGFQECTENVSEKIDEFGESSCFEQNLEKEEEPSTELGILEDESIENIEHNQDFSEELISLEGDKIYISSANYADDILNLEASTSDDECKLEILNRSLDTDGEQNCDDEYIELKPYFENHGDDHVDHFSQESARRFDNSRQKCEETNSDTNLEDADSDGEDEFDILQEHKYLVKRMKMEMRYSKVKGLPTISEECESQKTLMDDLKPLSIDEKLSYKDHMAEIQKFYGTYAEKMKKLDILNYQTLHAISFIHLKDSKSLMGSNKSPISLIKPYIPKLWPYKQHKIYAESKDRVASSTHQDLEFIYIGQVCNSWEILSWQYAKVKELLEYDSDQRPHSYSKVASEFQQFQVLLERFLEDEAFHGPRILHYVKTRCSLRTLLQIPMIKEDCLKTRKATEAKEEQINVSLVELNNMIKQSMQVFWEFLSTQKAESKLRPKAGKEVDQHDPAEAMLLTDIRLTLQQKERKLKDILRSRNCIIKKLQKYENSSQNHAVLTLQVELKLVSKVLHLRKSTTDQLMWCQRKLDNNCFIGRKLHVESSFFLLPC